jgi:nucleoside-diphosphate-sugar epimerase
MANYLVTGGAGFIGSHIVDALVERGETVRVLDNLSTGARANLGRSWEHIEFIEGSILDRTVLSQALAGIDYVLHEAALPSVPRSVADPLASHEANATGTLNVLVAAREAGVKRLVYASSSSVYGNSPVLPKHEDMPTNPLSPYAVSKLAGENYCRAFFQVYGLETVCLRYFNVFGPRQSPTSQYAAVIPKFIALMLRGEAPVIYGDGTQSRDFTYVSNVVQANLLACSAPDAAGQVLNVACGDQHSLLDLMRALNHLLGTGFAPTLMPNRPGDVQHSLADIGRAQRVLGYSVPVRFEEGLERTLASTRSAS